MTNLNARAWALGLCFAMAACDGGDATDATDADTDTDTDVTDTDTDVTDTDTDKPGDPTVVDAVIATERFSILEAAVVKAGVAAALTDVTVFAPNDDAFNALFKALGVSGVDDLSVEQLTAVLTYHVVAGQVDAKAAIGVANGDGVAAALGGSLDLTLDGKDLMVDAATVIEADIMAADGIIHEIDAVLLPDLIDVITTDKELTTLTAAVLAADSDDPSPDLVGTLAGGEFTVLAPTDAAFGELLSANKLADLDAVVDALGGLGGLTDVLLYHVLPGSVDSTAVIGLDGMSATTAGGGDIDIDVVKGGVVINQGVTALGGTNDANVVVVDILTSNGIIHKMDRVIAPGGN